MGEAGEGGDDPGDSSGHVSAAMGYEQARDELVEVVKALEVGGLSLDDSLRLWERGEALARLCERRLAGARERVEAVLSGETVDGTGPPDSTTERA